jgi:DnaJ-class molecular chaperone
MEQKDYYKVLGVKPDADIKTIKEAYRGLALKYHPDRNKNNPDHIDQMKIINEAYAVLSHPEKRQEYDILRNRFGFTAYNRFRNKHSEQDIFRDSDIFSVFEEISRGFGLRGYEEIFKEFYGTGYRKFEFQQPGFFAKGFVFSGPFLGKKQQKNLNQSQSYPFGKISRYLFKKLTGAEMTKNGDDIYDVIHLSPEKAREGGPYAFSHHKRSKKLVVKIPPGIRENQRIRLANMGEKGKGTGKSGDLYLTVKIRKPLLKKVQNFLGSFGYAQK